MTVDDTPAWTTSTFCGSSSCVEVAHTGTAVLMRDGKHPEQPSIAVTHDDWRGFITGIRDGEFEQL